MRLVIVGGGAGGAAAAARARRLDEKARIVLVERGPDVSVASCGLPYYAGGVIADRGKLFLFTPENLAKRFAVDLRTMSAVRGLDTAARLVEIEERTSGRRYREPYDYCILATGAAPLIPPVEGAGHPAVRTVRTAADIDAIRAALDGGGVARAVVVGGGSIGLEMAENLARRGIAVELVEMQDRLLPAMDREMGALVGRHVAERGVSVTLRSQVTAILPAPGGGCVVRTSAGDLPPAGLVVFSVGVRPEVDLARAAGLEIGRRGVATDPTMRTSDPRVFAVGDLAETEDPVTGERRVAALAGPAARQARVAVNTIFGMQDEYRGTLGTAIVKVFDLSAAMTGAGEGALKAAGRRYAKVYLQAPDHAAYYPGASPIFLKLLYDPAGGAILGAQAVGKAGVDKRIDVVAAALRHRLSVRDLAGLELCYAPPYGAVRDPVNLAGLVASNALEGLVEYLHWDQLTGEELLLDVRKEHEAAKDPVPGTLGIPLDGLRERLGELPGDRTIAVFCGVGYRSYIAHRILAQRGFKVRAVSGGSAAYRAFREAGMLGGAPR